MGLPLTMGGFRPVYAPGPSLGGDGESILAALGYDPAAIDALRAGGAFGIELDPADDGPADDGPADDASVG